MNNELSKRPLSDPLKIAAGQGKEALLRAIIAGKGLFETVEELVVPKKSLPKVNRIPQLPVFKDGYLNFNRLQPSKLPPLSRLDTRRMIKKDLIKKLPANMPVILRPEQKPGTPKHMKKVETGQTAGFSAYFLTGYRLGDSASFEWSRKWKFPSGLFRVKMHAGYDVALRFPIEVKGQIRPRTVTITGANDMSSSFDTSITANPVDGDIQFYEKAGYDPDQLPEKTRGKELALYFGFGYGYKFRALWTTVVPWRYYSHEYDWSKDFLPPYNLNEGGLNFTIPSTVTHTSFSAGVVKGDLNAVLKLGGRGKIHLDYETFHHLTGEDPSHLSRKRITFSNPNPITTKNSLPALSFERNAVDNFGFRLFNPQYEIRPSITPGVKVAVTLGYKDFSRTIKYGPVFFRALELLIPPITFDRFPESTNEYVWDHGRKYFKKR